MLPDFPIPDWPKTITLKGLGLGYSTSLASEVLGDVVVLIATTALIIGTLAATLHGPRASMYEYLNGK